MVKPFEVGRLTELVREKVLYRKRNKRLDKQRVGAILQPCVSSIIEDWLARAKQSSELSCLPLSDQGRIGHLSKLVEDLALRLSKPHATAKDGDAISSAAAVAHGKLRYQQGYAPAMLVHESRILQVTIFGTLQRNLNYVDFSPLLPDVMTIAGEVDSQLTQAMEGYMTLIPKSPGA